MTDPDPGGETLASLLESGQPATVDFALEAGTELIGALAALHRQGLYQRDFSPESVSTDPDGALRLTPPVDGTEGDGCARPASFAFRAPELLQGGPASSAADVYGLGVLLYRLLAGRHPYPADDAEQQLLALKSTPLPRIATLRDNLRDDKLSELIAAMLARDPEHRPTVAMVASSLGFITRMSLAQRRASPAFARDPKGISIFRILGAVTLAGLIGCLLVVVSEFLELPLPGGASPSRDPSMVSISIRHDRLEIRLVKHLRSDQLEENFRATQALADRQLHYGYWRLGGLHFMGCGTARDEVAAVDCWKKGMARGNQWAAFALGWMHDHGRGGLARDASQALRCFRFAADSGVEYFRSYFGGLYYQGHLVSRDFGEAARWFERGARGGCPIAMICLSRMYAEGLGVATDRATARRYREQAAQRDALDLTAMVAEYLPAPDRAAALPSQTR